MNIYAFEMNARRTGLKEGRAEGLAEGRTKLLETAKKLKLKGFTSEYIANITDLSIEKIEKL